MKYLAAIDFSDTTENIIDVLFECVNQEKDEVILLHVAEPEPEFVGYEVDTPEMREVTAKRYYREMCDLEHYEARFKKRSIRCKALLIQGAFRDTILQEAEKNAVNMLVIGSHGKNFMEKVLLGSVSESVLRHSTKPVLVVPSRKKQ